MNNDELHHYIVSNSGELKDNVYSLSFQNTNLSFQIDKNRSLLYVYTLLNIHCSIKDNIDVLKWIATSNLGGQGSNYGHLALLPINHQVVYSIRMDIENLTEFFLNNNLEKYCKNRAKLLEELQEITEDSISSSDSVSTSDFSKEDIPENIEKQSDLAFKTDSSDVDYFANFLQI